MATLYATVAEEKNALLQAILSKNQKQIHQCLLRAEHINRKDKASAQPLTTIINVTKLVIKLLQDTNHQRKKIDRTDNVVNRIKNKYDDILNEMKGKYENELHLLHRQLKTFKNENEALQEKLKNIEMLKEANGNILLTNRFNRYNAEREDQIQELNQADLHKKLPKLVDQFEKVKAIEKLEHELKLEKAARMRAENAVFNVTTSNDKRLHMMYTGENDIVDKMYKLEQDRQKAVNIAHALRKDLEIQIERSKRLKRLCDICMLEKESLDKQLNYSKDEINHLLNDKIQLKAKLKEEIAKEQLKSDIVKAQYIGKINAEEAFRKNLIAAHEKDLSDSFMKTHLGQTYRVTKRNKGLLDELKGSSHSY